MPASPETQSARRSPRRWWTAIGCLGIFTVVSLVLCVFAIAVYIGNHPNRWLFREIQRHGRIDNVEGDTPAWAEDWMYGEIFRTPTSVTLNSPELDDASFDRLSQRLSGVVVLNLEATSVTDEGLAHLANMRKIESLSVQGPHFSGACLQAIAALPNLSQLTLYGIPAQDDDLAPLAALGRLQEIQFSDMPVRSGLRHLSGLGQLRQLAVIKGELGDDDAQHVAAMQGLAILILYRTGITDAGLAKLRAPNLAIVRITYSPFTGAGFRAWPVQSQLSCIYVAGTSVDDAGVRAIARQQSLTELGLGQTRITDAALVEIAALENLNELSLTDTQVTDAGLAHLASLQQLRVLDLKLTQVRGAALAALAGSGSLTNVDLEGSEVGDDQLPALAMLTSLQNVSLSATRVTPSGVQWLQEQLPGTIIHFEPDVTRDDIAHTWYGGDEVTQ